MAAKTTVLIVDDSALVREIMKDIISSDPRFEVIGSASDPLIARGMIKSLNPDVLTLDVEMPGLDGITFLEKIMTLRPMPVVMVSTLTVKGTETTLRALELGAVDCVAKPNGTLSGDISEFAEEVIKKLSAAAHAKVRNRQAAGATAPVRENIRFNPNSKIIAIGASTGGVEAVRDVVCALPAGSPAVVITQHMPESFTASFAARLDKLSPLSIKEAADGDKIVPGTVHIAPGAYHLRVAKYGGSYVCRLGDDEKVSGHKPSVDVLFESVADVIGSKAVGVILTGMGKDGAKGLLKMKMNGANTIGQDESTCIVYGMPRAAKMMDAVDNELPLGKIASSILRHCQ